MESHPDTQGLDRTYGNAELCGDSAARYARRLIEPHVARVHSGTVLFLVQGVFGVAYVGYTQRRTEV